MSENLIPILEKEFKQLQSCSDLDGFIKKHGFTTSAYNTHNYLDGMRYNLLGNNIVGEIIHSKKNDKNFVDFNAYLGCSKVIEEKLEF